MFAVSVRYGEGHAIELTFDPFGERDPVETGIRVGGDVQSDASAVYLGRRPNFTISYTCEFCPAITDLTFGQMKGYTRVAATASRKHPPATE